MFFLSCPALNSVMTVLVWKPLVNNFPEENILKS